MPPKAILAGIMLIGFAGTLPFWLTGTPEQRQRMAENTTTIQMIQKSVGNPELQPEEKKRLRHDLQVKQDEPTDFDQVGWLKDMRQLIAKQVADEHEAETIARWVYVYSRRFDLSPELVLAVIAVESQFDHFAVSNVGARGLMQVMPFWKEELGSKSDNLFAIETNIRYGCAILHMYMDRYHGLERALAAYNGSLGSRRYPKKIMAVMQRFKASHDDL